MRKWLLIVFAARMCAQTPAIRVDQVGYLPSLPKHAIVVSDGAGPSFSVKRKDNGRVVLEGSLSPAVKDALSGDNVRTADFSKLRSRGEYVMDVEGVGTSHSFTVGEDVFRRAYYLAMRSFYGQRCGAAVDLGPEFPAYRYEACHLKGEFHPSSGRTGQHASARGWHDAGDYGRYVVNSGITTGTLLWTYEMFPSRVRSLGLALPESGNGTPDILNEIRWNLEWMLSMQDDDGGVWHKQTPVRFPGFVMPERDASVSVVVGTGSAPFKSSCATGDFAAVMAIAGRLYMPFDGAFATRARSAAERAWTWLADNPEVRFRNPDGVVTGEYGDGSCSDERLWAAGELWRTTEEAKYNDYFVQNYRALLSRAASPPGWPSVAAMGLWTYALGGNARSNADVVRDIRETTKRAAEEIAARTTASPYRVAMKDTDFVWGSNGVAANYGLLLLVADALTPDPRFMEAAVDHLHYLLGRNAFSVSWVTGLGSNWFKHPHHRPSGADSNAEPWPGLLSGGPNRNRTQDPALRNLPDGLPPMRYWLDDQESYASNENAINWNAPLVFVLAGTLPDRVAPGRRGRD